MLTHADVIAVCVTDQQAALEFYRDLLGFEVRDDMEFMPQARWITVAPPGAQTRFALWPAGMLGDEKQPGGFSGLSFACDAVQATHDEFAARGVTITQAPRQQPWGLQFMFADQDGNVYNVVGPG
jgi:predicted enzyme related to lactoylglutathione lyase